jgi:hypothetical protein
MATMTKHRIATLDEIDAIEVQFIALADEGKPKNQAICPRCEGELNVEDFGSAYIVSCATEDCLSYTARGI